MHVFFYLSLMQSEYQMACIWHICEKGKYWGFFLKFEPKKKKEKNKNDSIHPNFFTAVTNSDISTQISRFGNSQVSQSFF